MDRFPGISQRIILFPHRQNPSSISDRPVTNERGGEKNKKHLSSRLNIVRAPPDNNRLNSCGNIRPVRKKEPRVGLMDGIFQIDNPHR